MKDYNDVVSIYHSESDRAAVILAAAFLEEYMGHYLKSNLIKDTMVDDLFENNGPLSTFDSRAKMLYAMGLLPRVYIDDIKYIKKIRNYFAHHPRHISFDTTNIKDLCSNLSTSKTMINGEVNSMLESEPRRQYLLAIALVIMHMHTANIRTIDFSNINGA